MDYVDNGKVANGEEGDRSTESESEEESATVRGRKGNENRRDDPRTEWIFFKPRDCLMCTEVVDVLLENVHFALGEPMYSGFLPYYTHTSCIQT